MQKLATVIFAAFALLLGAVGILLTVDPAAILRMTSSALEVTDVSLMVIRLGAVGLLLAAAVNLVCVFRLEQRPLLHLLVLLYLIGIVLSHGHSSLQSTLGMWGMVAVYALPLLFRIIERLPAPSASLPSVSVPAKGAPSPVAASGKGSSKGKELDGEVKWFNPNKGFGFLVTADGTEYFVHFKSVTNGGRRSLRQGQKVTFTTKQTDRGEQADQVTIQR